MSEQRLRQVDLPPGVTLHETFPQWRWCGLCRGRFNAADTEHVSGVAVLGGGSAPGFVYFHPRCWAVAHVIVEDGDIRGWACHCCTCPSDEYVSFTCRNHGAGHDQDGCDIHRQDATVCTCCEQS